VEDLALHLLVAIREKDDAKLKSLASDRIKGWPDALPVFAVELREHFRQATGSESFDLRASESLINSELAVVKCTGPEALHGMCLVLNFVKTADGWRNHSLRNSSEQTPLAEHLAKLQMELQKVQQPQHPAPPPATSSTPSPRPWGTPDQGVAVRLRPDKPSWTTAETPSLKADFRNQGTQKLTTFQAQEIAKLEVDGIKYRWSGASKLQSCPLPPGREYYDIPITLGPEWRPARDKGEAPPSTALKLAPGRHLIRLIPCVISPGDTTFPDGQAIAPASNPVELEIAAATGPAAVSSMPWGEPVNGVAVHLQADLTAWNTDDPPVLNAMVRNQGKNALPLALGQAGNELEIDGQWYAWHSDTPPQTSILAPGAECSITLTLSANWEATARRTLALKVGQPTIRFAVRIPATGAAEAVRAISNPTRIDIVRGVRWRAALVARYLLGYQLRSERTGPGSLEEVLVAPDGKKVNLAEIRIGWQSFPADFGHRAALSSETNHPAYGYNAKLVEFFRPLHLKVTNAAEAEDIVRIIMTVFCGWAHQEDRQLHTRVTPTGWQVDELRLGSPALGDVLGPIELILKDGVLYDVKRVTFD
jgi:hypothetical protein